MGLKKTFDQRTINFLGENPDVNFSKIDFSKVANDLKVTKENNISSEKNNNEQQRAKKINHKDLHLTSRSIFSARTGKIKDTGGPARQMNTDSSNSIWDSQKLAKLFNTIDSKTKTKQDKEVISANKRANEQQRMDEMADSIKSTEQRNASSVSPMSNYSGSKYNNPSLGISIFDNDDFERVPDKTNGEIMAEETRKKRADKDESWKKNGRRCNSKTIVNNLFDKLIGK